MKNYFIRSERRHFLLMGFWFLILQLAFNPISKADGNLYLTSGGTLNNVGTLVLLGNLTNNGNASLGSGSVKFAGTSSQSVSGTNTFQNLEVNNTAGITIDGTTTVNGILTLTNGLVTLGTNNLLLGPSASIAGTPNANKMVVATGSGQLQKQFSGNGTFSYPVGDNTGTAEYSPVSLSFTSGVYGSGNWAGVNLVNSPYPGSTVSYLNRYWIVSSNGISGFNCNAQFNYVSPADVVGTESDIYCVRVAPLPSTDYNIANTTLHQLTANGLSSFGTFTGRLGSGSKRLNLASILLEGLYNGSGMMRKTHDAFGEHFGGDTADVINVELHKASDYSTIKYSATHIGLSTSGVASVTVPGIYNESYYVTIKHRNSIETTSATTVDFSGATISYAFNTRLKAYGNNMGLMIDGTAVIYTGDVNQDRLVDGSDLNEIGNLNNVFAIGYLVEDINGDGLVDGSDLNITGNNNNAFISAILP